MMQYIVYILAAVNIAVLLIFTCTTWLDDPLPEGVDLEEENPHGN